MHVTWQQTSATIISVIIVIVIVIGIGIGIGIGIVILIVIVNVVITIIAALTMKSMSSCQKYTREGYDPKTTPCTSKII